MENLHGIISSLCFAIIFLWSDVLYGVIRFSTRIDKMLYLILVIGFLNNFINFFKHHTDVIVIHSRKTKTYNVMYEQIHFRLWIIHGKKALKKLGKKGSGFFHKNSSQDVRKLFFL